MTAGERWTVREALFVEGHIRTWLPETIAAYLGRTPKALRRWCERERVAPCRGDWLTSGPASELAGVTPQRLTALARSGRVKARRVPGGKWWLFDPAQWAAPR